MRVTDYPFPSIAIACRHCARSGRYRRDRYASLVGGWDRKLPDALADMSADCPRRLADKPYEPCGVFYPDLLAAWDAARKS